MVDKEIDMTFNEALEVIRHISRDNTVLDGLQYVRDVLEGNVDDEFGLNDEEVAAYHIVVEKMRPLFA